MAAHFTGMDQHGTVIAGCWHQCHVSCWMILELASTQVNYSAFDNKIGARHQKKKTFIASMTGVDFLFLFTGSEKSNAGHISLANHGAAPYLGCLTWGSSYMPLLCLRLAVTVACSYLHSYRFSVFLDLST